jgi:RNA-directed DNA polymerase
MQANMKKVILKNVYDQLCSFENLELAFKKARKGKTTKRYVIEFEDKLFENLEKLRNELLFQNYNPLPLKTFILRDPKTRKINKSAFRDRVVHHAICNIIESVFDEGFIFDSYANRKGKGTFKAIERFDHFKHKISKNNTKVCFILKADVKHYFDNVSHEILLSILKRKITDERLLWLIKTILANYNTPKEGKGMPLGNLTSQFFANVYLNELDQFVKHKLRAKYYIRYVDDFVIFHESNKRLERCKKKINFFLKEKLDLELHPDKSKVLKLHKGICFLGLRIFFHHKLIRKKNLRKFEKKFEKMKKLYDKNLIEREKIVEKFEGWLAYVYHANTYKYRKQLTRTFNNYFPLKPSLKVTNVTKYDNFEQKIKSSNIQFSQQKTLQLLKKGLNPIQIAEKRKLKDSTIWEHFAGLIENYQIPIRKVLDVRRVKIISSKIFSESDSLKSIKKRLQDPSITYEEINCVLANVKCRNKKKNICYLSKWYQRTNCYRKCYLDKRQREKCKVKFDNFTSQNPTLEMKTKEFLIFFNNHVKICILPEKEKLNYTTWEQFKRMKKIIINKKKELTY